MKLTPTWQRRLKWPFTFLLLAVALIVGYSAWQWYFLEGGGYNAIFNVTLVLLTVLLLPIVLFLWRSDSSSTAPEQLTPDALQNPRNRENLLNSVQTAWIDGVLHHSIHGEIIKLYLTPKPDAVGLRPWELALKQAGKDDQPLPTDYNLLKIFAESGRNLLILGQPGSGKTFNLLQLAEPLITVARQNPTAPLPVILNLSSWAQEQKPLADWMADELIQHGVARRVTRAGIAHNQFLYLLDGLDEVATDARDACVTAINTFKAEHPAEMVICSRSEEYGALQEQLRMGTAIEIQPLTPDQVDHYLSQEGLQLEAVRTTLRTDPDLRELAQTPLMLSLMTLAYQGEEKIDLRPRAGKEARRRHIFDYYIAKNFERRPLPDDSPYTQEQATTWLSNLARGMVKHEQSVFYIERLQPTWLGNGRWHRCYRLIEGSIHGLIFGLIFGLVFKLLVNQQFGASVFLLSIFAGLLSGWYNKKPINLIEKVTLHIPSWTMLRTTAKETLLFSLLVGLEFSILISLLYPVIIGLSAESSLDLLEFRMLVFFTLVFFLSLGLYSIIIVLFMASIHMTEVSHRSQPNQGVRSSAHNSTIMGLFFGVLGMLLVGLLNDLPNDTTYLLLSGLLSGLLFGLFRYGGETVSQHYTLRWLLARAGTLPYPFRGRHLITFFDAMQERILLRRVGGGWIFIHRSLLEHFASLKGGSQ